MTPGVDPFADGVDDEFPDFSAMCVRQLSNRATCVVAQSAVVGGRRPAKSMLLIRVIRKLIKKNNDPVVV